MTRFLEGNARFLVSLRPGGRCARRPAAALTTLARGPSAPCDSLLVAGCPVQKCVHSVFQAYVYETGCSTFSCRLAGNSDTVTALALGPSAAQVWPRLREPDAELLSPPPCVLVRFDDL